MSVAWWPFSCSHLLPPPLSTPRASVAHGAASSVAVAAGGTAAELAPHPISLARVAPHGGGRARSLRVAERYCPQVRMGSSGAPPAAGARPRNGRECGRRGARCAQRIVDSRSEKGAIRSAEWGTVRRRWALRDRGVLGGTAYAGGGGAPSQKPRSVGGAAATG
jgi:hypothetical protein